MRVIGRAALAAALIATFGAPLARAAEPAHWVGSWAAGMQVPEPANALPPEALTDATLRQVVHLSLGGRRLRVQVSNAMGTAPLHLDSVHLAQARAKGSAAIAPGSDHALSFDGHRDVLLPAGADYWSDPVEMTVAPGADLTVSMHLEAAPKVQTGHPGSRATSFVLPGDHTADLDLPGARTVEHWYQLSGVDVAAAPTAYAVVAFGDSITDGHGATTNGDDRWPDVLAARLRAAGRPVGVLNLGIGGNRVLLDGLGPSAMARLDRDVLARDGVRTVILLEGVNDLGTLTRNGPVDAAAHADLVQRLELAYAQLVAACRAHGVRVLGATILPFAGTRTYKAGPAEEADRRQLNAWIRAPGHFDGVVDFDRAMDDPAQPGHLNPAYDTGDHLHPSAAGYRVMGEAIPLSLIR